MLYFEKAANFCSNKNDKLNFLIELITLLNANKDFKKLKSTIKELNKIDVVLESIVLEALENPYY